MTNQELIARDLAVLWHPCSQMKDYQTRLPLIPIKSGRGIYLEDFEGKRYIDAISSWWVNLFGHANSKINAAISKQLETLEHVILAGCSHEPAVELAEKLVEITPPGLNKVFYVDNGSSAIEAAMKMSFHYWQNSEKNKKTKFINLSNSYHGETLGALALGDVELYKKTYEALLLEPITVPSPDCFYREAGESWQDYTSRQFVHMEQALAKHADEVCAVILEPLVQCAGSMRMYHPDYLTMLRQTCDKYGVHIIADEIAVGFGRTGTMFACEQANITPDFMCLSKGITGGYLPLSVVLTSNETYNCFYDDYDKLKAFLHSHSYTGNALACSAALATLEIFKTDNVIDNNQSLSKHLAESLLQFKDHPHIGDVRQHGMIAAVEMVQNKLDKTPYHWQERRGLTVYEHGLEQGVLLRPLGNVVYFMPPYIINPDEISHIVQVAYDGINLAVKN